MNENQFMGLRIRFKGCVLVCCVCCFRSLPLLKTCVWLIFGLIKPWKSPMLTRVTIEVQTLERVVWIRPSKEA